LPLAIVLVENVGGHVVEHFSARDDVEDELRPVLDDGLGDAVEEGTNHGRLQLKSCTSLGDDPRVTAYRKSRSPFWRQRCSVALLQLLYIRTLASPTMKTVDG